MKSFRRKLAQLVTFLLAIFKTLEKGYHCPGYFYNGGDQVSPLASNAYQ